MVGDSAKVTMDWRAYRKPPSLTPYDLSFHRNGVFMHMINVTFCQITLAQALVFFFSEAKFHSHATYSFKLHWCTFASMYMKCL